MLASEQAPAQAENDDWEPFVRKSIARESRMEHRLLARITSDEHGSRLAWTTDLSAHGLGIACDFALTPGASVTVSVVLSAIGTLPMNATVAWSDVCQPGRMGLQLEKLDGRLRLLLTTPKRSHTPRLPRHRDDLPLCIGVGGVLSKAWTYDVSARGIGLCARVLPPQGTRVLLEITLPGEVPALADGTVAWAGPAHSEASLMIGGVALRYADEAFFRYVLDRQETADWAEGPTQEPA